MKIQNGKKNYLFVFACNESQNQKVREFNKNKNRMFFADNQLDIYICDILYKLVDTNS